LGITPEYQGPQESYGDFAYWVGRDGAGNTRGFRRLLNGDNLDMSQPLECLNRDELPSKTLQKQYDVLVRGGIPSRESVSTGENFRRSLEMQAEVTGKGGQDMVA